MCSREVAMASRTIKAGTAKCSKEGEKKSKRVAGGVCGLCVCVCVCKGVNRDGLPVPNGWWCCNKSVCSNGRCNTSHQQRLQPLLAERLNVWTAGLISASMLAHNMRITPTHI